MSRPERIHPSAIVSVEADLAEDVEVGPFAIIGSGAKIGPGCRIGAHAQIIGDVAIGAGSVIGRSALIGGEPQDLGFQPGTKSSVRIGRENVLREHVTVHRSAAEGGETVVGDHNFLMVGAHLAHDVSMGDHNVLANNVLLAGHVEVGDRVFLGGGTVVHQFIRLGDFCLTQGNSAISKDVPPYVIAFKLNRFGGVNVIGLRRAGFGPEVRKEIRRAVDQLLRAGKPLRRALEEVREQDWGDEARRIVDFVAGKSRKGVLTAKGF